MQVHKNMAWIDDAKVIDSSALSIEQVFDQMRQYIDQRLAK